MNSSIFPGTKKRTNADLATRNCIKYANSLPSRDEENGNVITESRGDTRIRDWIQNISTNGPSSFESDWYYWKRSGWRTNFSFHNRQVVG